MSLRRAALLLVLLAAPAAAQDEPAATRGETTDPTVIEIRDKFKGDPALVDAFAERVAKSQLSGLLTTSVEKDARIQAARDWINNDPDAAARVAVGLMRDDANGTTVYEDSLMHQFGVTFEHNPGAEKNLYGRLRKSAKDSKLLKKQSEEMSEDERREILRTLFEGKGAQSDKVIHEKDDGSGKPTERNAPAATSFNGIYDRLSEGNLRGVSPKLLVLQSSLNAHRPPGAPALAETGKFDYATLSYPAYGMNYDVGNLEERIRRERIWGLARLAGRPLTARDWKDPDIEAKLLKSVPADKLSPRLKSREALVAKARAATKAFLDAAEKAKDPNKISKSLLVELGQRQKETARWILAAAQEAELSRVEEQEGFFTEALRAAIDAAPAPAPVRDAYKRRGEALKARVAKVKTNAQTALDDLQSDGWAGTLAAVDALVTENRGLTATLSREIDDFVRTPFKIAEARVSQPRWRDALDDCAVRFAPSLSYSREVLSRRGRLARLLGVFGMISSGEAAAAHNALVNETGGR